jgi:nucleotide-binding universal stress UspA family protein
VDADGDGLDAALVVMARDATPEGTLARSGEEIVRHAEAPVLVVPPA